MLIGEKLEHIRKVFKIKTKSEMASILGLEHGSYSDITRGKTKKISGSVAKLLEILFCVNVDNLNNDREKLENLFVKKSIIHKKYGFAVDHAPDSDSLSEKDKAELIMLREMTSVLRESNVLYKNEIENLKKQLTEKNTKRA